MAAAGVSCRALVVLRLELTRALSVRSFHATRKLRDETTWCRRTISHRGLSTTSQTFSPTFSPILRKDSHDYKDAKNSKDDKNSKENCKDANATADSATADSAIVPDVVIEYNRGLPRITVPLPSRKEKCIFILKPITSTVADFLDMLKNEDRGIDRAVVTTIDGTRIGCGNTITSLLEADFKLVINDVTYDVSPPNQEIYSSQSIDHLSSVKATVTQLYDSLNCQEYKTLEEQFLLTELEEVNRELQPLELKRLELEEAARKTANTQPWLGLMAMAVQFGILARLTWFEYSWDIMEPITYFVTYGTGMLWYIYFIVTRQECMLADVLNRRYLTVFHKKARKMGLDVNHYNALKERAYELETALKYIRGPMHKHKTRMEQKMRERSRSSSSSSSSSRSPSSSPSPSPSPKRSAPHT